MSSEGSGVVTAIAAPALAPVVVGGVLVAGAAYVGGVCVVQAAKGMVAVAHKVDEHIRAHAAKQEAIYRRCEEFEQRVIAGVRQAFGAAGDRAPACSELLKRLRKSRRLAHKPLPDVPQLVPITLSPPGGMSEPIPGTEMPGELESRYSQAELDTREEAVRQLMKSVQVQLRDVSGEEFAGLLEVTDVEDQLTAIQKTLNSPDRNLHDLQRQLKAVNAEIAYRTNQAHDRYQERGDVADILERAGELLVTKAQEMSQEPGMEAAISVAEDLLTQAQGSSQAGDFAYARQLAASMTSYLDQLSASVNDIRRDNLGVAIDALGEYVAGFKFASDDDAPDGLEALVEGARSHLNKDEFDACWERLQSAQSEAGVLAQNLAERSREAYRDASVNLARDVLQDMEYQPGDAHITAEGSKWFEAVRPDGASFRVTITPEGLLRYKTEGFGDTTCQDEAARFFDELQERGMAVNVESELSARSTADRMTEVLLRQGFSMVKEQVDPNGREIVLTASGKGEPAEVKIDADGIAHGTLATEAPQDRGREAQWQAWADMIRARRAQHGQWGVRRGLDQDRRLRT